MSRKRPIDIQRNAAIALRIGGNDRSPAMEFLSTGHSLYVIKGEGVYKIQLADDIDPARTNPNIPNVNQEVLPAGYNNEIVARILLTAKYLFDEKNNTVTAFVASLFEECLVMTRHALELDAIIRSIEENIIECENASAMTLSCSDLLIPSLSNKDNKVHHILSKADKIRDTILAVCYMAFLPDVKHRAKLADLENEIKHNIKSDIQTYALWEAIANYLRLIRNARNASEHPRDGQKVVVSDFSINVDGKIQSPLVEIQHPDAPIRTVPLREFVKFIRETILEHAELMLVFIRCARLLNENPFGEWVAMVHEENRRHKDVRYYRVLNLDGSWRILE